MSDAESDPDEPKTAAPDLRRWHDMGGRLDLLEAQEIDRETHDYALWEKRIAALMVLAGEKGLMTVDGLRRVLEDMGAESFASKSYYERWIHAVTQNLLEGGVFTVAELRAKTEEIRGRGATYGDAAEPSA